jgi:hypothetical protein
MLAGCAAQRSVHAAASRNDFRVYGTMADSFDKFPRLPAEIRSMIWEYALPDARVYEVLDAPNAKQRTPAHDGLMFANVHPEPPPALASVCRESRSFVLHNYKPLRLGRTTKYVDLSRDMLLLEPYLLVKRLHRTLNFMTQIPLIRDNLSCLALGTSYGIVTGICHPVLSWKVAKGNMGKMLASLAKFPRLRTLIFVVHQEFQFEFDFNHQKQQHLLSSGYSALPSPPDSHSNSAAGTPDPYSYDGLSARPQLVHQAYRFKFDIETNINHTPGRRPHTNEMLYYPLAIDEDNDDWEEGAGVGDESECCDPWPTNDDWRRFRKRFRGAIHKSFELGLAAQFTPETFPQLKGASLLWRYTKAR